MPAQQIDQQQATPSPAAQQQQQQAPPPQQQPQQQQGQMNELTKSLWTGNVMFTEGQTEARDKITLQ